MVRCRMVRPIPGQPGLFFAGLEDDVKAQSVRVADVLVVGPLMLAGARAWYRSNPWGGLALGVLGVATIIYNAGNYMRVEKNK